MTGGSPDGTRENESVTGGSARFLRSASGGGSRSTASEIDFCGDSQDSDLLRAASGAIRRKSASCGSTQKAIAAMRSIRHQRGMPSSGHMLEPRKEVAVPSYILLTVGSPPYANHLSGATHACGTFAEATHPVNDRGRGLLLHPVGCRKKQAHVECRSELLTP